MARVAALPAALGRLHIDRLWLVCSLAAAGLLLAATTQPLWTMELHAPQYPAGLELTAYGTRLEGDIEEVNSINHYVGVRAIHTDDIRELDFFPYAMAALVAALLLGAVFARRRVVRAAIGLSVWGFALGFLLDLQWWLYRSGHDRSADAAYRIDDFTPRVLGGTTVVNFESDTMVAPGFWLIVAAAMLVTVVPLLVRFLVASWRNTAEPQRLGAGRR
jgi:copper chaperone NosL